MSNSIERKTPKMIIQELSKNMYGEQLSQLLNKINKTKYELINSDVLKINNCFNVDFRITQYYKKSEYYPNIESQLHKYEKIKDSEKELVFIDISKIVSIDGFNVKWKINHKEFDYVTEFDEII